MVLLFATEYAPVIAPRQREIRLKNPPVATSFPTDRGVFSNRGVHLTRRPCSALPGFGRIAPELMSERSVAPRLLTPGVPAPAPPTAPYPISIPHPGLLSRRRRQHFHPLLQRSPRHYVLSTPALPHDFTISQVAYAQVLESDNHLRSRAQFTSHPTNARLSRRTAPPTDPQAHTCRFRYIWTDATAPPTRQDYSSVFRWRRLSWRSSPRRPHGARDDGQACCYRLATVFSTEALIFFTGRFGGVGGAASAFSAATSAAAHLASHSYVGTCGIDATW